MRIGVFIAIATFATLCAQDGSAQPSQSKTCFPQRALHVSGSWTIVHLGQPYKLTPLDCLEDGDLIELDEGELSGAIDILYLDGTAPAIRPWNCRNRSECANAYRVEAPSAPPATRGRFAAVIEFFESFGRSGEQMPVSGITRGQVTLRPSVLCSSDDGTVDLSAALSGAPSKSRVRFLRPDAAALPPNEFPVHLDVDRRPSVDAFALPPGLYFIEVRDREDMLQGKAYALVASSADCPHLRDAFALARQFTASLPKDVGAEALLDFQSIYLQALAHDSKSAPTPER
jgi:hypothetical protein